MAQFDGTTIPALPGYRLLDCLHQGSRTAVYRARHTATEQPVVVKVLTQEYPSFSDLVQFRNQYTVTKNLPLSGIVRPLDLLPWDNSYALVMEDTGGLSLEHHSQQQSLSLGETLNVAIQLADILHDLHQQRVIHKDIKPANILIHPDSKQVKLIDFSIASLLPKETQALQSLGSLEGTLAYMAPEQTGRMNRGIDYRTDFYGLGVTFYQLLTGQLPFTSNDPLELIHCHMAQVPPAVEQLKPDVPAMAGAIAVKLMAKNAEDRYQSALGLKHDLERCLVQWDEQREIAAFALGERDVSDRFLIPEKLYGREQEAQTLLEAFDRVANGTTELMLVAGFSGIGKTAVVSEVHKPITRQQGYFIKGKFDQFNRNIPFSAFVQAFRDLMNQLLSESDERLVQWKIQILEALGENAQVIVDLIPELGWLIGPQPPAPELSGTAAQNRFNLLFQRFIHIFTTPEHPLVMFVDDLQWADSASLNLIQVLMAESKVGHLLLLGAYRDNEVFAAHPLMLTLDEIEKLGAPIHTITLQPLEFASINHLVADTLHAPGSVVQPLTELVMRKTQGNPFFATQFLKSLHQDHLIAFDRDAGHWQCDITRVRDVALTDDVVEFMTAQLQKLPDATQCILRLAACIGAQFDLETLAIVSEQSQTEVATDLWKAVQDGLILPQSEIYKFHLGDVELPQQISHGTLIYQFLHDRVQQAAYSLIPEEQKQAIHLKMGQLLLQKSSTSDQEERLFEIANHLNVGIALMTTLQEREHLSQLNLAAGRKAKIATAYSSAVSYLSAGIDLLPKTAWESHYSLALALHEEIAEASYLNTDFEQMERWAEMVLQKANTLLDTINVQKTRIMGAKSRGQLSDSINIGLQVLQALGIGFPEQPTQEDIGQAYEETRSLWAHQSPQSLLDLPTLQDPHRLAAMEMLTVLVPAAYMVSPNLMLLLIFKQVEISIQSGNSPVSIFAYGDYGIILCGIMGDVTNGYEFGELALSLLEKFQAKSLKGRSWYVVHAYIKHWKTNLADILPRLQAAYYTSLDTGDMEALGWNSFGYCSYSYHAGQNLAEIVETMEAYRQSTIKYKQAFCLPFQEIYQQTALNLLGQATVPYQLSGEIFDQEKSLSKLQETNQRTALFFWFFNQSILYYVFGQNSKAIQVSAQAAQYLDGGIAMFMVPLYFWFDALIQLTQFADVTEEEQQAILLKVQEHQGQLQGWAMLAPTNHQHRWELLEAERLRVLNQHYEAGDFYDRAIASAKENGFIQDEALANELAAKFYLDWGKEKIAAVYMQEAYYCYARWGAKAKVADLETRYPELLRPILQSSAPSGDVLTTLVTLAESPPSAHTSTRHNSSSTGINQTLDFASILKASQVLASTIELDELLRQLTQIILQNSGGDRCALILPNATGEWQVRAIATPTEAQLCTEALDNNPALPVKLIQYVKNTQAIVVIDDLVTDLPVIDDYLTQRQPKSVLCLPILNQGQLIGILYLKNHFAQGVFTEERVLVLNFLCTQAAISLENARLYQQVQQSLTDVQQIQLQLVQSEKMSALGGLVAGVAHEINNPVGCILGNVGATQQYINDLLGLLDLYAGQFPEPGPDIEEELEDIDLDYVREDLPKLMRAMKDSGDRIKSISQSLRTFSRADTDTKQTFNLHEGIDSTVLILRHRLKANGQRPDIEVVANYGDIPEIHCFPGQLNQVFMNILANAIDAFDEVSQHRPLEVLKANLQRIIIRTGVEDNWLKITIADNGPGIPAEIQANIFDHLFTTKEVGKGTGLGLAIARQIVEDKHGGSLAVHSEAGQGTEFRIQLPLS
jgi:predicted ATPase/signal transduction histidine kinase